MHDTVDLMSPAQSPLGPRTWCWRDTKANVQWVFGMRWLPALGSQGQKAMQRSLRKQGFMWAVNHGKQVRLIGLHPERAAAAVNGRTASAAVAFAGAHPEGVHALCLEVQGIGVWLVAAADGCVLSDTDRWFDSLEQAQACLQGLRERHDKIALQTSQWCFDEASVADAADKADFRPDFLQANALKQCRFCRLPSAHAYWQWLVFMVLVLAAVAVTGYQYWPQAPEKPVVAADGLAQRPTQAPLQVHRYESLAYLFETWHDLPVDPAGWLLQSISCRVDASRAICQAAYKRREPGAHNEGLQGHEPPGWTFASDSLDRAFFKRTVEMPMRPFALHHGVSTVFGLSQLQRLSARVAGLSIGTPNRLEPITLDRAMTPSHQFTVPAHSPIVQPLSARNLTLRIALRQTERLQELTLPLRWRQVDLSVVHGAQIDALHGYLMLNLQGEWLETH